jgi:hypothetical protein
VWKYLVVVSYTGVIDAAGHLSCWRLALRKTGTGLMALTVLLLPVTFLAGCDYFPSWVSVLRSGVLDI